MYIFLVTGLTWLFVSLLFIEVSTFFIKLKFYIHTHMYIYTLTYSIFSGGFFPLQRLDSVQVVFFNSVLLLVGFLYNL